MRITVDKRGFQNTQREVARLNGLLVEEHVETPCSVEVIEKTYVPLTSVTGHTRHVLEISLPRLSTGSHIVWAFAHSTTNEPGKFNSFYMSAGAPEDVRSFLDEISVADCDHCNLARNRHTTYVVQEKDTGILRQVGSSCLSEFTGLDSQTVHSLDTFKTLFDRLDGQIDEGSEYVTDTVLATSLAVMEDEGAYIPQETFYSVREHLDTEAVSDRAVDDFKAHVGGLFENEYVYKVKELLEEETVFEGQLKLLVSSVSLAPRGYTDEYVGEVDEKIQDSEIRVLKVKSYDDYSRISGVDEKNRQVTWFKSHGNGWGYNRNRSLTFLDPEIPGLPQQGESLKVSSARVKKLSVFNGEKQTQLSHVRVKKA